MSLRRFLIPTFALALAGCAVSPEERLVGVWKADIKASQFPAIPVEGIEKRVRTVMESMTLKLRSDKTFVLSAGPTVEGAWSYADGQVQLVPQGKASELLVSNLGSKQLVAKISPDVKDATIDIDTPFGKVTLVLRKSA